MCFNWRYSPANYSSAAFSWFLFWTPQSCQSNSFLRLLEIKPSFVWGSSMLESLNFSFFFSFKCLNVCHLNSVVCEYQSYCQICNIRCENNVPGWIFHFTVKQTDKKKKKNTTGCAVFYHWLDVCFMVHIIDPICTAAERRGIYWPRILFIWLF